MGSLKQWWYVFSSNKSTFLGGILPITILITILGCFSLLYSNTINVLNYLYEVSNYSLILKQNTSEIEVDKLFQKIQKNSNIINAKKVTPSQTRKDLLEAFDKINQDLQSVNINKFPYVIEFTIKTDRISVKKFLQELKKHSYTYSLVSGLDSSSQIKTLFFFIRVVGGFFLLLLATSIFYIVHFSIDNIGIFLNFLKKFIHLYFRGILF